MAVHPMGNRRSLTIASWNTSVCTRVCGSSGNRTYAPDPRAYGPYHSSLVGDPVYGGRPRPPKGASEALSPRCVSLTARRFMQPCCVLSPDLRYRNGMACAYSRRYGELIEVMRADFEEHKDEVDWFE